MSNQVFGVRPAGRSLQILPLPIFPPIPTPASFVTFSTNFQCPNVAQIPIPNPVSNPEDPCNVPVILSELTNGAILGCSSPGWTSDNINLIVPPGGNGCYKADLLADYTYAITGTGSTITAITVYTSVCRNNGGVLEELSIQPSVTCFNSPTPFDESIIIRQGACLSASVTGTVCLAAGDNIVPCLRTVRFGEQGSPTLNLLRYTLTLTRLSTECT